jgi:hypothetical protein
MTNRGGGEPMPDMAFRPRPRMDPPPRSFAADAHGCIMVATRRGRPNTSLTNGFLDHMTWHCWGLGDFMNGVGFWLGPVGGTGGAACNFRIIIIGQDHGYCVGTDPSGDRETFGRRG